MITLRSVKCFLVKRSFFIVILLTGLVLIDLLAPQPSFSETNGKTRIETPDRAYVVTWSADGQYLAIGSVVNNEYFVLRIWNFEANDFTTIYEDLDFDLPMSWNPQSNLLTYSKEYTELYIEDIEGATEASTLEVEYVTAIDWNSAGELLATANGDPLSREITVWDPQSGEIVLTLEDAIKGVDGVAWSPDNTMIAGRNWDASVSIWETQTGTLLTTLDGGGYYGSVLGFSPNQAVTWSPDSSNVAVYANTNLVESYVVWIWNVANEELIATLDDHEALIKAVAWSPDGSLIATGSNDTTICIWDAKTFELLAVLDDDHTDFVNSVAWSPDGTQLASASKDGTVVIQNITVGN